MLLIWLAFALEGSVFPRNLIAQFDMPWEFCRSVACSCIETPVSRPAEWPELDIHADGYTLRSPSFEFEIPRRNGTLDPVALREVLSARKIDFSRFAQLRLDVEALVTLDEVVMTMDALRSLGGEPYLQLAEPPSRDICIKPGGCAPMPASRTVDDR